jgi:mannose/fructose-specific phosphotransferase system component IIA
MTSSTRALIVAHASLAEALIAAVDVITGRAGALRAISNEGLGARDLYDLIGKTLDETSAQVVFTDLPAGSCAMAARRLLRERPDLSIVCGVNLPMLLEFVTRDANAPDALAMAVARGREHVTVLGRDVG